MLGLIVLLVFVTRVFARQDVASQRLVEFLLTAGDGVLRGVRLALTVLTAQTAKADSAILKANAPHSLALTMSSIQESLILIVEEIAVSAHIQSTVSKTVTVIPIFVTEELVLFVQRTVSRLN